MMVWGYMIQQLLNFLSIELTVLLTAALPIIELRGLFSWESH